MGPIAIRRQIRSLVACHTAGLLIVLALAVATAAHHSDLAPGGMHHEMAMTAVELCVGALTAIGAAVAALSLGVIALGRWSPPAIHGHAAWLAVARNGQRPEARAGPSLLPVICVWRW